MKGNCHNSGTSDDIDMKLGPVTKLNKINKTASKNFTMTPCHEIVTSLLFFQFMANFEQSGSWSPDAYSVNLIFLLIVTFYLTKTKNRTKKSLTALPLLIWVKVLFWPKSAYFLQKTADLKLKGIFSETTYGCVLTCQIWSF